LLHHFTAQRKPCWLKSLSIGISSFFIFLLLSISAFGYIEAIIQEPAGIETEVDPIANPRIDSLNATLISNYYNNSEVFNKNETNATGFIGLICSNNQIIKWSDAGWLCGTDSSGISQIFSGNLFAYITGGDTVNINQTAFDDEYARLDGTNQPFTGDIEISKEDASLTLRSVDDGNTRLSFYLGEFLAGYFEVEGAAEFMEFKSNFPELAFSSVESMIFRIDNLPAMLFETDKATFFKDFEVNKPSPSFILRGGDDDTNSFSFWNTNRKNFEFLADESSGEVQIINYMDAPVLFRSNEGLAVYNLGVNNAYASINENGVSAKKGTFTESLAIGSNSHTGLSNGDINASTIYYDVLVAKSPIILCSEGWCSVDLPQAKEGYYFQKDDDWNIIQFTDKSGKVVESKEFTYENGFIVSSTKLNLNEVLNKTIRLRDEILNTRTCLSNGYSWTNDGCYNIYDDIVTYKEATKEVSVYVTIEEEYTCKQLNPKTLVAEETTCVRSIKTEEVEDTNIVFKEGCSWSEELEYYCRREVKI
jgi:hypothetical protein